MTPFIVLVFLFACGVLAAPIFMLEHKHKDDDRANHDLGGTIADDYSNFGDYWDAYIARLLHAYDVEDLLPASHKRLRGDDEFERLSREL